MLILLYALVFFTIFFRTAAGDSPLLEFGSCSTKCQISLSDSSASRIFPPHQCSCSQSCAIYGDCCYDSLHRTEVKKSRKISCLQVHGRGSFQAVSACPSEMNEMDFGCSFGIGHLPPATSKTSGVTYANIFCAFCNEDYNLHYWNVEQRCKEENESRSFDQHQNPGRMVTSQTQQHCEYYAHNDDFTFIDNLELRSCSSTDEIFRCSPSWRNDSVSQLCNAYSDPVYVNNKLYKNLHCAECNYEILTSAKCQPAIVETLLAAGMNATEIYQMCKEGNFIDCLNYIHDSGRGKPLPFRYLFKINEKICIPKPGKLCCEGERFDPRSKTCRKVIHSFRQG